MKHTWTLLLVILLGIYEVDLLCQIAPEGPSQYITLANQELDKARMACDVGSYEDAKAGFEAAIDFLAKGKAAYQELEGEETSVRKMDELIATAEREREDCLKKETDTIQSNEDQDFTYDPIFWDQIDLTSPASKRRQHKVFPWWWVAGPVAIVTGTVLILTRDEEDDTPPPPIAANIGLVIECGAGGSINPTLNDIGRNINITDFDNSSGWVTLQGNTMIISTDAVESFTITYTITDELGRTSMALVEVTVTMGTQPIPVTITMEVEQGGSGTVQVFDFFECEGCNLTGVDPNLAFSLVSTMPSGEINFQLNPDFVGEFSTTYYFVDRCQREGFGTITFLVGGEPCEIEGEPFVTDATCGLNDGVIGFVTEELFGAYNFLIEGELTSDTIRHLAPGNYQLRVELAENTDCFETYDLSVGQGPFDILENVATTPGNCFTSGGALLSVQADNLPVYYPEPGLALRLTGEGFDIHTELPESSLIDLVQIIEAEAGVSPVLGEVTVIVSVVDGANNCSQSLTFFIEEEEVDLMIVEDRFNTEVGTPLMGNVLLNDMGTGLEIIQVTPIAGVIFEVAPNGLLTFISESAGIFQSAYTVRDTCGREATANIRIEVAGDPACELSGDLNITPASCGIDDGAVLLTLQIDNVSDPEWQIGPEWTPEGPLAFVNNQLGTGSFSVNITEVESGCSLQLNGFVPESPANYITNISTEDASCIQSGDIIVTIMDMPGDYLIQLLDGAGEPIGEWPGSVGENSLSEFAEIAAGAYTVIVTIAGLPERCQSMRTVQVLEQELPLMINDLMVQIEQGDSWMGNVLANDMGTGLQVVGFTQAAGGVNTVQPNGMATFTPNQGFSGQTSFLYTARDTCGNQGTATVFINVQAIGCDITFDLQTTPASCGAADGSAQLTLNIAGVDSPVWNVSSGWTTEGNNIYVRENMPVGAFSVVVTEMTTGCTLTINGEITEEQAEFIASVSSIPGSCFVSGDIVVEILNMPGSFSICLFDDANNLVGEWPGTTGSNSLQSFTAIPPGDYIVTVKMAGAPPSCVDSEQVNVEDVAVPFQINDDNVIIPEGTNWNGNVLLNDIGTGLTVLNHTMSPHGQVTVQENGTALFIPNPGFTGPTFFMYTALDICGRTDQALVTITVTPVDCDINGVITSTPASCGKNDGSATATIQISGVASPIWSLPSGWVQEGDFVFVNNNLSAGNLTVVITETSSGCSVELNTTITEEAADYILNISSSPSTCIPGGDIVVDIMDMPGQYLICLLDEALNIIGEWPGNPGQNSLQQFTEIAPGNYTVVVKVEGLPVHCQSSGAITVDEIPLPLMVNDDMVTINQGASWSGNVLDNDMGTGLMVVGFTQAPNGLTTVDAAGNASFTPNPEFNGVTSFTYTVEDACGQMGTATVTITVNPADCTFTGEITVTPATCGVENGAANFNITNWPAACDDGNACTLSIMWSNGAVNNPNTNLPVGNYSATVTLEPLGCSDVFDFTIDSEPIDYFSAVTTTPGNCLDGGNIMINFNNQSGIAPSVSVTVRWEGDQVLQTNVPWGAFDMSDFITVFPGSYEIILQATGLSEECSETLNLEVPEVDLPLTLTNQLHTIAFGETWTGNVLDNAVGTSLVVFDFTAPPQATLNIALNGDATLVPDEGFSGTLVFEFTAVDICGQMATAMVTVVVGEPICFFIQSTSIIPGNCNVGNEAIAVLNNPDGLTLTVTLTNPMNDVFMTTTNGSTIELSSLTELIGGTYLLEVSAGNCTDQLNFAMDDIDMPSLDLLEANPPSNQDAFDGSILLNVSGGNGPYIILVNGDVTGPFIGGLVNLTDLPEGVYELVALDGNECPSMIVEVALFAGLLASDNDHPAIFAGSYTAWSPRSISQIAVSDHWIPGLMMPEHTELPRDILVTHGGQIEVGGSFGRDWRYPIRISAGQVGGRIEAHHPMSGTSLTGQWRSHYAGISIAPQWKIGQLKGNIQLGGILGHLSGYLAGEAVDFDLQMLTRALRFTPTMQIPVSSQVNMEVGYDLLMNLTTQGNRINSVPNITFSATF